MLDDEIINYIDDDAALTNEIEQSDDFKDVAYAAIIRAKKDYPGAPSTLARSGSTDTDSAGTSGVPSSTKRTVWSCLNLLCIHSQEISSNGSPSGTHLNMQLMTMTSW